MLQDLRYQKIKRNREEMLEHLKTFNLELKPAIGIWSLGASGSRFHEPYFEDKTIEERLEIVARLAEKVKVENIDTIFKVDLSKGSVAETICAETGAEIETLYSCHVISAEYYLNGETYISLMERNLKALEAALN